MSPLNRVLLCLWLALAGLDAAERPPAVILQAERIAILRQRIAEKTEPTATAWIQVLGSATAALTYQPQVPALWSVPGYYGQKEAHQRAKTPLQEGADAAYALALAWQMTGEERFAQAAARIVIAWAGLKELKTGEDSSLSFCYHFPPLIFAADLLRGSPAWRPADEESFRAFLRSKALPMNTMKSANNWGNWGLVLFTAIAAFTEDSAGLATAEARWKEFIDRQIGEDGRMHDEVGRNSGRSGIWYSHFSLMPQTIAGELLRVQGRDVFSYASPRGRTLKTAYARIADWSLRPATFPFFKGDSAELHSIDRVAYFEILLPRWPIADAQAMVGPRRPLTSKHGLPYLTFTHGETFAAPASP